MLRLIQTLKMQMFLQMAACIEISSLAQKEINYTSLRPLLKIQIDMMHVESASNLGPDNPYRLKVEEVVKNTRKLPLTIATKHDV